MGARVRSRRFGDGTIEGFEQFRRSDSNKYKEVSYCDTGETFRSWADLVTAFFDEWNWSVIVMYVRMDEKPRHISSTRLAFSRKDWDDGEIKLID